ncbi:serine--tRNA ligase [Ancylostoma ceylanicum]|uniref:serine--tRNA ligase n=1 Tax=Ancylostoma ceylanicum TaxID=53326 RepID=A0A0D6LPI2_9BILA|nr:serine--tRNA ligase [Ancylostoma ceylanicum]
MDEAEMEKIQGDGVYRKRFDLDHLDDNIIKDFVKSDAVKGTQKNTLVRRCNYLSEKILTALKPSTSADEGSNNVPKQSGFGVLNRIIEEDEKRLESNELVDQDGQQDCQSVAIKADHEGVNRTYTPEEAANYKAIVLTLLESSSDEDILIPEDEDMEAFDVEDAEMNGTDSEARANGSGDPSEWGLSPAQLNELHAMHDAVAELLKHFWMCFPPVTPELEEKLQRMAQTLRNYEANQLREAERQFGKINVQHCHQMLARAHTRERKGVGDIDKVQTKWKELQALMEAREKPSISEDTLKKMWDDLYEEALKIPNMSHPGAPKGGEENAKVITSWGERREGSLLTAEKLVQPWRTLFYPTDVSGERSYAFVGALANLERVVLDYVFDRVCVLGFKPVSVPDLVAREVTEACGVSQRTQKDMQYTLQDEPDIVLSGTAEMGISALLRNKTFEEEQLPLRVVAMSRNTLQDEIRCYRPEISNSAAEAKLYRVHEFTKVEMYVMCTPEQSEAELEYLVQIQKGTFESFGLHCRQMEMPTEELGAPAARKIDVEAWMPGRQIYGEVSSASNCTDYQARRLGIRYKTKSGEKKFVHTCNGTAVASTRTLISILETFQNERKSLDDLPEVIRKRLQTQRPPPIKFQQAKPLS